MRPAKTESISTKNKMTNMTKIGEREKEEGSECSVLEVFLGILEGYGVGSEGASEWIQRVFVPRPRVDRVCVLVLHH